MKFNSRTRLFFVYISFFSFLLLIIQFRYIIIFVQSFALFIFIMNILSTIYFFNIKNKFFKKISFYSVLALCRLKFYSINNKYWKVNCIHTYLLVLFIYIISTIPKSAYDSIIAGIFSSSITSVFIFHISFTYEKYKFKQNLYELYKNLFYLLDVEINRIEILLKIKDNQLSLSKLKDNIRYIENESSHLYNISNCFLNNINNYDDISYISIEAYNNIINKKINDNIKELIIKIISGSINMRLIKNLYMLRCLSDKLNEFSKDLLKIVLIAKEIEIKLLTDNSNDNFSEDVTCNNFDIFCQILEKAHHDCLYLKEIYMELFKEFETIFNKQ